MTPDQIARTAERLTAARRQGQRLAFAKGELPTSHADAFAIQEKVVAALASPVIGWKVIELPGGEVIFAPLLEAGIVPAGGTWKTNGKEPAGIELEIAFRMAKDVAPGAGPEAVLDAIETGLVVFELCESRLAEPDRLTQAERLADCILNSGIVVGSAFADWRTRDLKGVAGRLLVDGREHKAGTSVDPIRAIQVLAPALAKAGKRLARGQIVITGSLIGMNWLSGQHAITGEIAGCGTVAAKVHAA